LHAHPAFTPHIEANPKRLYAALRNRKPRKINGETLCLTIGDLSEPNRGVAGSSPALATVLENTGNGGC
jgi:hypothetical protein